MPLYDYRCPVCGARYELLRRIREMDEPATCPLGHAGGIRADVNRVFQKAAPGTYSDWYESLPSELRDKRLGIMREGEGIEIQEHEPD